MPTTPFRRAAPPDRGFFPPSATGRPAWRRQAELAELERMLRAVVGGSPTERNPPVTIATAQRGDGFAALALGGPLDGSRLPALVIPLRALLDAGTRHVVVDLSRTGRLDGRLATILQGVAAWLAVRGGVLDLTGLTPRVLHRMDDDALARVFVLHRAALEDGARAELSWAARRCPQGLDEVAEPHTAARNRTIIDTAGRRPGAPRVVMQPRVAVALAPQEEAAAEVAGRVLGATLAAPARTDGLRLVRPDGRRAALEEATVGEPDDLRLDHLRRAAELQWPAPGRWWWRATIHDVRRLARIREVFPVAARACEARMVTRPDQLPVQVTMTVPDLHWLVHTEPARLVGDPAVLDHPTTVTLGRGRATGAGMAAVPEAVRGWLAGAAAVRALGRLSRRRADERQLYLTVGCTAAPADAFDALVRANGVPPELSPPPPGLSHLWLAPVLGPAVFLWSRLDGWSRHEPYVRGTPAAATG